MIFLLIQNSFNLIVIKDFLSKDQKIKINNEDIPLFFNSEEGIAWMSL